jgi:hypothetical protein
MGPAANSPPNTATRSRMPMIPCPVLNAAATEPAGAPSARDAPPARQGRAGPAAPAALMGPSSVISSATEPAS